MPIASERGKAIFQKTARELTRLGSHKQAESVHAFRTTTRRLETLLKEILPECNRNQKKLLKVLSRIRKRAGRVRDIDVQLGALRSLRVPQEPRKKTQLMQQLIELRQLHEGKLRKSLKKSEIRDIQKRLEKARKEAHFKNATDPLNAAKHVLESVKISQNPANGRIDDETLHRYRLAVKRARYAAEFAPPSAESSQFIAQLKRLQDALGHWHDWATLTQTARQQLGEVNESSLVAVLHNVTNGKRRNAMTVISSRSARPAAKTPSVSSESRLPAMKGPAFARASNPAA